MAENWQAVTPLDTEDPPRVERRSVDVAALVAGVVFVVLAVGGMAGLGVVEFVFSALFLWPLLVAAGVVLLVSELRRTRRRPPGGR